MNNGYIRSLDGVRAIAILLVMTFHAGLNDFGWMGVQLFFVLSGFLITRILWNEKFREGALGYKFKKFWVRRSLRIFPLYFGFLLFLGITYLLFRFPYYYDRFIPWLATYTFNYTRTSEFWLVTPLFTHLWSLSIEEQFYLLFPLVVFFMPARFVKIFMIAGVVLSPLSRFLIGQYFASGGHTEFVVADAVYWHTLSHLDAFFAGGLITVLRLDTKTVRPQYWLVFSLLLALAAGVLNYIYSATSSSFVYDLGFGHGRTGHYEHVWYYTVLNFVFASLVLNMVAANGNARLKRIMEGSWLVNIGKVSYGMYIFHWAILVYVFHRYFHSGVYWVNLLLFIPYALTVYLAAWASYRFFESRFIQLKDRIFPSGRMKKPAGTGSPTL